MDRCHPTPAELAAQRITTEERGPQNFKPIGRAHEMKRRYCEDTIKATVGLLACPAGPGKLTEAYLRVHPDAKPASAAVLASRLLRKVKVQARIAELQSSFLSARRT
jgi:hypothetical protein